MQDIRFDPWIRKIPWRRKWLPTLVFSSGESHGQRSLVGYGPQGHKELDMTEQLILPLSYEDGVKHASHKPKSVQFSRSVVSDSLRPHGRQHASLPCPSPTPGGPTPLSHPSGASQSPGLRSPCFSAVSHHLPSCYCPQAIVNSIVYLKFLWGWI